VGLNDLAVMRTSDTCPSFSETENTLNFVGIGGGYTKKDGFLYVSIDTAATSGTDVLSQLTQDQESPFGRTLRHTIIRTPTGVHLEECEIFSFGHRDPQGMVTFDDLIMAVEHNDAPIPGTAPVGAGMTDPAYAFVPSIGIRDLSHCPEIDSLYPENAAINLRRDRFRNVHVREMKSNQCISAGFEAICVCAQWPLSK